MVSDSADQLGSTRRHGSSSSDYAAIAQFPYTNQDDLHRPYFHPAFPLYHHQPLVDPAQLQYPLGPHRSSPPQPTPSPFDHSQVLDPPEEVGPIRKTLLPLDPFDITTEISNEPSLPFTPAGLATLPRFLKERSTATFALPGSLLHVPGLLFPGGTFIVTLQTANVPMRLGGDGLAKFSQLLPAAARAEPYHLHLVFRDWPAGQVAEFPDTDEARKAVERMGEVISPMPGYEFWHFAKFVKIPERGGKAVGKCVRVLRGFRGHGEGQAEDDVVLRWMRKSNGKVPVDEEGGRIIMFATGLYFAPVNQRITGSGDGGQGSGGGEITDASGQTADDGSQAPGSAEEDSEKSDDETENRTAVKGKKKGRYVRSRKSNASRAFEDPPFVAAGTSAMASTSSTALGKVRRDGLRPRSGRPAMYAQSHWEEEEEEDEESMVDLTGGSDEEHNRVKEEEEEDDPVDEIMPGLCHRDEIYDYDS